MSEMSEDGSNSRRGRNMSRHGKMNRKDRGSARGVVNFANLDEMEYICGMEYGEDSADSEYGQEGAETGFLEDAEIEYNKGYADSEYGQESLENGYMDGYADAGWNYAGTHDVREQVESGYAREDAGDEYAGEGTESGYMGDFAQSGYAREDAGNGYGQEGAEAGYKEEYGGFYYEDNGDGMGYAGTYVEADDEGSGAGYGEDYAGFDYEGDPYADDYVGADYEGNGAGSGYAGDDTVYEENGVGEEAYVGGSYGQNGIGIEDAEAYGGSEYGEYLSGGYAEEYVGSDDLEYGSEPEYIEDDADDAYAEYGGEDAGVGRGRKKRKFGWMGAAVLCAAILIGARIYIDSLAYKICRVEAGVMVAPSDFLKNPDEDAVFTEDSQPFDIGEPGEYAVKVKSGLFTHKCTLIIQDTIPPKGQAVRRQVDLGADCGPEEFVTDIADATEVTVSYVEEPDFTEVGAQSVRIALTDRGNNQTILETEMFVTAVMGNVTVEAGEGCPGLDRFVIAAKEASFVTDITHWDYNKVEDHEVVLRVDGQEYTSILHVVDTTPPEVEVHDIEGYALQARNAEDFITSVKDITKVQAAFAEAPDLSLIGTQEVTLLFTDEGNNEVVKTAELTLMEDKVPPVIHGAKDISIYVGESVSYRKNVSATDNCPEGVTLSVDNQGVNINEPGVYPVTYRAEDLAGNTSTVTINLTVRKNEYDVNEVNAMADAVLAQIITPEMSQWDKAEAIYKYVSKHITYISTSVKGNWVRAAWEGLSDKKGDCYVFACTAKVLLTRADITNMDIAKITPTSEHYWSLVDVGDGWYHYDTTPRKDHTTFFMWTDEDLMAYSDSHNDSHKYDHSLYPEVN